MENNERYKLNKELAQMLKGGVATPADAALIANLSKNLGEAMVGINEQEISLIMAERGK